MGGSGPSTSSHTMRLRAESIGFLIGAKGSTVNAIQTETGARINIDKEEIVEGGEKYKQVTLSGSAEAIDKAKQRVEPLPPPPSWPPGHPVLRTTVTQSLSDGVSSLTTSDGQLPNWFVPVALAAVSSIAFCCLLLTTVYYRRSKAKAKEAANAFTMGLSQLEGGLEQLPQNLQNLPQNLQNLPQGLQNLPQGLQNLPQSLQNLPQNLKFGPMFSVAETSHPVDLTEKSEPFEEKSELTDWHRDVDEEKSELTDWRRDATDGDAAAESQESESHESDSKGSEGKKPESTESESQEPQPTTVVSSGASLVQYDIDIDVLQDPKQSVLAMPFKGKPRRRGSKPNSVASCGLPKGWPPTYAERSYSFDGGAASAQDSKSSSRSSSVSGSLTNHGSTEDVARRQVAMNWMQQQEDEASNHDEELAL